MTPSDRLIVYPGLLLLGALALARQEPRASLRDEGIFRKVTIVDEKGHPLVILDGNTPSSCVTVLDPDGTKRVELGATSSGGGTLLAYGSDKQVGVFMGGGGVSDGGTVRTYTSGGKPLVYISSEARSGTLEAFNSLGRGVYVRGENGDAGSVTTYAFDGTQRVALATLKKGGGGSIEVMGPTGKPCVSLAGSEDGGGIHTTKPSGAIVWASTPP